MNWLVHYTGSEDYLGTVCVEGTDIIDALERATRILGIDDEITKVEEDL